MASMSDYLERKLLDHTLGTTAYTFPSTVYLSLHTADPTDVTATALANEVTGGSYGRQIIEFVAAAGTSGLTSNEIACVFPDMPDVTVTHIGIMEDLTGGELLYHGVLTTPKDLDAGDTVSVAIGAISVTLA
jgi:hypothetical protein